MPIRKITAEQAAQWESWLHEHEKLKPNTLGRRIGIAKQFFAEAIRLEYLQKCPLSGLKRITVTGDDNEGIVEREEYFQVRKILPSAQWRLFADLGRFGGLRLPSEAKSMRWKDIDWKKKCFLVHSQKTQRYKGKDKRVVPLFPELYDSLKECYDQRDPNDERIFTEPVFSRETLTGQFRDYIRLVGVKPWKKALHRLRASRETELIDEYSVGVACKWIGNSPRIALENYHKMRDVHFRNATESTPDFFPAIDSALKPEDDSGGSESGSRLDHFADQHTTANTCKQGQDAMQVGKNCQVMPQVAGICPNLPNDNNGLPGLVV